MGVCCGWWQKRRAGGGRRRRCGTRSLRGRRRRWGRVRVWRGGMCPRGLSLSMLRSLRPSSRVCLSGCLCQCLNLMARSVDDCIRRVLQEMSRVSARQKAKQKGGHSSEEDRIGCSRARRHGFCGGFAVRSTGKRRTRTRGRTDKISGEPLARPFRHFPPCIPLRAVLVFISRGVVSTGLGYVHLIFQSRLESLLASQGPL